MVATACGTAASSATAQQSASDPIATVEQPVIDTDPRTGTEPAATADGGLDEACVQRVLGRAVTGFSDVTAAERDAIFQECSRKRGRAADSTVHRQAWWRFS